MIQQQNTHSQQHNNAVTLWPGRSAFNAAISFLATWAGGAVGFTTEALLDVPLVFVGNEASKRTTVKVECLGATIYMYGKRKHIYIYVCINGQSHGQSKFEMKN